MPHLADMNRNSDKNVSQVLYKTINISYGFYFLSLLELILGFWLNIAVLYFEAASAWPKCLFLMVLNHEEFDCNMTRIVWQTI